MVVARLDELGAELCAISSWLMLAAEDKPGITLECAVSDVGAACWSLQSALRTRPESWLTRQDPGVNGAAR
jgi:hypothetical protein